MNGKIVGSKPLYVALAQRKELRRAQLEAQFAQRAKMAARLPGPAIYNGQSPMFYAQPPGQPGFVYPQMVPRGRFPPGPYQPMPNYVMVAGAGGRGGGNVKHGRGGAPLPGGARRGMKQNQNQPQQPQQQQQNQPNQVVVVAPNHQVQPSNQLPLDGPVTQSPFALMLAPLSPEDQKRLCGEKIYPVVVKQHPNLAGKITGMILESAFVDELVRLIEDQEALNEKINEAHKVLKEHAEKTGQPLED